MKSLVLIDLIWGSDPMSFYSSPPSPVVLYLCQYEVGAVRVYIAQRDHWNKCGREGFTHWGTIKMSSCSEPPRSTATKSSITQREGLEQVGRVGSQTALPMARQNAWLSRLCLEWFIWFPKEWTLKLKVGEVCSSLEILFISRILLLYVELPAKQASTSFTHPSDQSSSHRWSSYYCISTISPLSLRCRT